MVTRNAGSTGGAAVADKPTTGTLHRTEHEGTLWGIRYNERGSLSTQLVKAADRYEAEVLGKKWCFIMHLKFIRIDVGVVDGEAIAALGDEISGF